MVGFTDKCPRSMNDQIKHDWQYRSVDERHPFWEGDGDVLANCTIEELPGRIIMAYQSQLWSGVFPGDEPLFLFLGDVVVEVGRGGAWQYRPTP